MLLIIMRKRLYAKLKNKKTNKIKDKLMIKIGRLMKKTKLLIFVVTLFVFNICFCQVSFRAKGPSVVGVNEGFSVNFTISNVKNPSNFIAPTFRGVNIMAGPSTSS